ncbi:MAG: hypothetical protein JSS10_08295 [Verrucomicrobia bacterium]|nr:hypothetical protein [Verrucomicrobiota bacterium]
MKKLIAAFFLLVSSLCHAKQTAFFDNDLKQLLEVMAVSHDGTPKSIVDATQKKWIRPAGKERWEVEDTLTTPQRNAVIDFCNKKGFFREIKPAHHDYDYALILGATVLRMEKRMSYLAKLAEAGVHFKKVILLSGARPLDASVEAIPEGCKTECDAMEYLWKAQPLSKQVAWKHYQHPMVIMAEGKTRRPTTADTFALWMKDSPQPGRCFFVSNQPYCFYQQAVAENLMPSTFVFETVGAAAEASSQNAAVMLDTIARCLYESNKR